MVKIALDAMGGDNAPAEIVKGAVQAIAADKDCFVYLVGKEDKIKECLNGQQYDSSRIGNCYNHLPHIGGSLLKLL